jgi:hypothetical protein
MLRKDFEDIAHKKRGIHESRTKKKTAYEAPASAHLGATDVLELWFRKWIAVSFKHLGSWRSVSLRKREQRQCSIALPVCRMTPPHDF